MKKRGFINGLFMAAWDMTSEPVKTISSEYVVELSLGIYLAAWPGDPGRTHTLDSARKYKTRLGARIALGMARKYRPFKQAQVNLYDKI